MTETLETATEIQTIRFKIESIEGTQQLLLRSRAKEIREDILPLFQEHAHLADVYLAVDGKKSQAEVVEALKDAGVNISQPTVSRRLQTLIDEKLVEEVAVGPRGMILRKKEVVERGLRLSKYLFPMVGRNGTKPGDPPKS